MKLHAQSTLISPLSIQDGLVFRIQVAYHREPQILRESLTPEGMLIYRDNAEAQALELETLHKPFLTSTLHGYNIHINMQNTLILVLVKSLFR